MRVSLQTSQSSTSKRAMALLCTAIARERPNTPRWATLVASQLTLLLSAEPTSPSSDLEAILDEDEESLFIKDWSQWKAVVLELARCIVRIKPHLYSAWLLLAKTYVAVGMYEDALVALNSAPVSFSKILKNEKSCRSQCFG